MKGNDYFPISKFSAENYANLDRCPESAHRKSGPEVCRQRKKPHFHAQKQTTSGSRKTGFSRSAGRSCRRVTGASTTREQGHRIQRPTGRGGPANIRHQATVREALNRLSDNSSQAGKKNEKKCRQDTDGRQLMASMEKVRNGRIARDPAKSFGCTRGKPPP